MTVRERVQSIQRNLRDGALTPDMTRESLVVLTALFGNVGDELRAAEHDYKVVLLAAYETEGKANRAKLVAEVTDEYGRYRAAKDMEALAEQMMISCRAYLRSLDSEMKFTR